jgi:hypothetical protein
MESIARTGKLWLQILCFALSAWGIYLIFYGQGQLIVFAGSILTAAALFVIRAIGLRMYGAIEILFAMFALWNASGKHRGDFNLGPGHDLEAFEWLEILLQTGGAVYVLIRGLVNFGAGVMVRERLDRWRRSSRQPS